MFQNIGLLWDTLHIICMQFTNFCINFFAFMEMQQHQEKWLSLSSIWAKVN